MMEKNTIIQFIPRTEVDSRKNLKEFIRLCKEDLMLFDKGDGKFNWDDYTWKGISFTTLGTKPGGHTAYDALDESFIDFSKAYIRYSQSWNPSETIDERKAVILIERAFLDLDRKPNICDLNEEIMDAASALAIKHITASAYTAGRHLEILAKFVTENNLVIQPVLWYSDIPRYKDKNKTGAAAKKRREEKCPDDDVLNAIGLIYAMYPKEDKDVFASSVTFLLLCAPSRISEIIHLPVYCEDIPDEFIGKEDKDGNPYTGYGWRFRAGKGYDPEIKWVPEIMHEIAREAIERIKKITQPARDFAKALEDNPNDFPRHELCPNVNDNDLLTAAEVVLALGFDNKGNDNDSRKLKRAFLRTRGLKYEDNKYTLKDLLKVIKERLPDTFPFVSKTKFKWDLKFSEALFCTHQNQFHCDKATIFSELTMPTGTTYNNIMGERTTVNGHKSIFERYGYNEGRNEKMEMNSHSPRHLLNNLSQRGGFSQELIAKWSGRKDVKQNKYYNHIQPQERFEKLANLSSESKGDVVLFDSDIFEVRAPVSVDGFVELERMPVHTTELGFCEHDFSMSPCSKHRDCLNCEEEVCVKGDTESLERMKGTYGRLEIVVKKDEILIKSGEITKDDQSYKHNKMSLERLGQKIQLMESDELADGVTIRLANKFSPTQYELAIGRRVENGLEDNSVNTTKKKALDEIEKKANALLELIGD